MPLNKRQQQATRAAKPTGRMVGEQASQLQGLHFRATRCEELAIDAGRHLAAVIAAAPMLDFHDEPSHFIALLRSEPCRRGGRR